MTNKALGRLKLDENEYNKQKIYSALYLFGKKATSKDIWKLLDHSVMRFNQKMMKRMTIMKKAQSKKMKGT